MSDSVDRVFSHALNTVNKIRGAEKPPANTRLKLYGLYKQSMEGDVEGIMERPDGNGEGVLKWEAWKSCAGSSRTEAKSRYITLLISTMRQYASSSADSRELVDELEFVWDQVKHNYSTSSGSSPPHHGPLTGTGLGIGIGMTTKSSPHLSQSPTREPTSHPHPRSSTTPHPAFSFVDRNRKRLSGMSAPAGPSSAPQFGNIAGNRTSAELRMLTGSPLTHSVVDDSSSDGDDNGDEFVDAPDSQVAEQERPPNPRAIDSILSSQPAHLTPHNRLRRLDSNEAGTKASTNKDLRKDRSAESVRWRKKISSALIKLTAEVAALREQMESRRGIGSFSRRPTFFQWIWPYVDAFVKHVVVDLVVVGLLLLWLRRKKAADQGEQVSRLENAARILFGDAVHQVQRVGTDMQRGVARGVGAVGRSLGQKKNG